MIVSFSFFFFLFAGELEKQQGAKTHSVKSNGTQLELRSKQGSLSGECESSEAHVTPHNTAGVLILAAFHPPTLKIFLVDHSRRSIPLDICNNWVAKLFNPAGCACLLLC